MYNQCDRKLEDLQSDNEYLQQQLDQHREAERRRYEEQEQRRAEAKQECEQALCEANSWPDAFWKNGIRLACEAKLEVDDLEELAEQGESHPPFFQKQVEVNDRAGKIYQEEAQTAQAEIEEIQARIRANTIIRLRREFGDDANMVIGFLEDDDPAGYVYW